ncbi:MAG: error-prone DNA polymerase, partial [Pirellulaceae bacterium]|nr:error-prone DNA polymerase [Pirellulaceae bacterium]
PGPIQGDMVHPYLRRRNGEESVSYPNEAVKRVLGKTLGVPLFQEQAMQLAVVAAGFTPGEADQLRRAIAAWRTKEKVIDTFEKKIVQGMLANGYNREFAQRCFGQIKGFSEYGFPESHAASFAMIVYVSAWLKKYHPAAFAAALINSQPMGFYAPAQIVRDAAEHGVQVCPVDVNDSVWDCMLAESDEGQEPALRLGMRLVKGLREQDAHAITEAVRRWGPFDSIERLWQESGVRVSSLRCLAAADAFGTMGLDRQTALWQVRALRDGDAPLFGATTHAGAPMKSGQVPARRYEGQASVEGFPTLPPMSAAQQVRHDYATIGLSLKAHPIEFIRCKLATLGATACGALGDENCWPDGGLISVAGLVLIRQRPGTASGIVFMTLEDESGIANLIVRPHIFARYRKAARHGAAVLARGKVERQGQVVHVMVHRFLDLSDMLVNLNTSSRDFH